MRKRCLNALQNFFQLPSVSHKLDFLDGYRAIASMTVILSHFVDEFGLAETDWKLFNTIGAYGIASFFSLSSFLLTYRVMSGYDNSKSNQECLLKTILFAIRRCFRIYVPFIVFWTILYSLPHKWDVYIVSRPTIPYMQGLKLQNLIATHLWTVPVEVKYYFFIPFISYLAVKSGRHWYLFTLLITSFIVLVEYYKLYNNKSSLLYMITTFLCGSVSAICVYNVKKFERLSNFLKSKRTQVVLGFIVLGLTIIDLRFNQKLKAIYFRKMLPIRPVYVTVITLPLLVLSAPNLVTAFYNLRFLRSYGRLSYGIYLFHYIVLGVLKPFKDMFQLQVEAFVLAVLMSYLLGIVWTYTVENLCGRISEAMCTSISQSIFFTGFQRQKRRQQEPLLPNNRTNPATS